MSNRFPEAWKAVIAFFAPGAAMILTAITETSAGGESITSGEWIGALATAVVVGGTVYAVPNRTPAAGGTAPQDHAQIPEVLHPGPTNGIGAYDAGSYANGGYTGDSKTAATYHAPDPTDVPIARYGDEPLPPVSGQSGSTAVASETGSDRNYVPATDWDEAEHHGIEADQTPVAGDYEPKHKEN